MNKTWCVLVLILTLGLPAWAADEVADDQMAPPPPVRYLEQPVPGAGASLLAAVSNVVYFPVRFVITLVTAETGGFTGWMTGGNEAAAYAVWESTDGQAFIEPEVLEGRQRLHFGHWQ